MERRIGVVLLLHVVAFTSAVNETSSLASSTVTSAEHSLQISTTNKPLLNSNGTALSSSSATALQTPMTFPEADTSSVNTTLLDFLSQPAQGDGTKKSSVPRKGIKEPVKPRKGAELPVEQVNATSNNQTSKSKPLALMPETLNTEDEVSEHPDYTALIVGLSLGIALVLILASVTYWRLRDVWERRQYKRVDFLIDGLYTDT